MDRRNRFREGLNENYLPIYDRLCNILPPRWQPYCGVRTFSEQTRLYSQGRDTGGKIVTNARAGMSPHNYGCASDWTLFDVHGKPIWLSCGDSAWDEYQNACHTAGAGWGILLGKGWVDCPHNELPIEFNWRRVYDEYYSGGMKAAYDFISNHALGD